MNKQNKHPRIGVFASHFQGDFIGDLANQIRQCCELRGYQFIGFSTGGVGQYNSDFYLAELDGAIVICNSVCREFAEKLVNLGIATVSIAFDYYPLDIPVISSDNTQGAEMAFNFLHKKGHVEIAFIGDLREYDVRKRYERFSELMLEHQLCFPDEHIVNTRNSDISGGLAAAEQFCSRGATVSAVFCASGLTMIGFMKQLKEVDAARAASLEVLGYDASPIAPVLFPNTSSVVQNIHIIAYRALSIVCERIQGNMASPRTVTIAPKLMENAVAANASDSPYLATSVDLPEIYTPGYVSSLINNSFAWSEEIYESKLEGLMGLSPMFEKFMQFASFSQISRNREGKEHTRVLSLHSLQHREKPDRASADNFCDAASFPSTSVRALGVEHCSNITHFFVKVGQRNSGVLSLFGEAKTSSSLGSYLYFCGQMDIVMKFMSINMQSRLGKSHTSEASPKPKPASSYVKHPVVWRLAQNTTDWSSEALALLGLTQPMDINIYCHMDITDRVHPEDCDNLRKLVAQCAVSGEAFAVETRLKSKQGQYVDVSIAGKSKKDNDEQVVEVVFLIGLLEPV